MVGNDTIACFFVQESTDSNHSLKPFDVHVVTEDSYSDVLAIHIGKILNIRENRGVINAEDKIQLVHFNTLELDDFYTLQGILVEYS